MRTIAFCSVIVSTLLLSPSTFSQTSHTIRPELTRDLPGDPYNLSPRSVKRPKVGLILTGGGSRGLAHIGVLKSLERNRIPIDFIAGNSMGAIIGGLYAAGYTIAELESIAVYTNWADVLSLSGDTRRSELYVDQKQAQEHTFLLLHFDGLEPIIPSSISSGQRLTNHLTRLAFQALYHPSPHFDDMKISFRATATDLISGKRIVIESGSLAEALRGSVTVPLLFAPLKRDSLRLVDGGLVSNAPVDLARASGCDIIIASNTTSGMRSADQISAPWETADQIMNIMMRLSNEQQLGNADLVISPLPEDILPTDFSIPDSLITLAENETDRSMDRLKDLLVSKHHSVASLESWRDSNKTNHEISMESTALITFRGDTVPEDIRQQITMESRVGESLEQQTHNNLSLLYASGGYQEVYAEIITSIPVEIVYHVRANGVLKRIEFAGNTVVSDRTIRSMLDGMLGRPINFVETRNALENVLREYRNMNHSLARIDSLQFDEQTGTLSFIINEGVIRRVIVRGTARTGDYVIRREFPQQDGELFDIVKAERGIVNINSTGLFEYVLLDIEYEGERPIVVIKVEEKGTNNVRLGIQADNERKYHGLIDIRDVSLFGTGAELGFTFGSSFRNRLFRAEYRANRIFNTVLTFGLRGYFRFDDYYSYANSATTTDTRWSRVTVGEYRQIRYGGTFTFGTQLERFGNTTVEFRTENQRARLISGLGLSIRPYQLVSLKVGTAIDTKNRYPFPTSGVSTNVSFESAMHKLGSDVTFGKFVAMYESYSTAFQNHTFHPRLTLGIADNAIPPVEYFGLGGLNSFLGLREDDTRGKQMFVANIEYRFHFPFKIVFDTFLKLRYDLGMISATPREIQLTKFHHGIGTELALDTPIGPASFAAGRSFFVRRDLKDHPVSVGPWLFYFSIGYGM
jgi:NTE family protein